MLTKFPCLVYAEIRQGNFFITNSFLDFRVSSGPAVPTEAHDAKECFAKDAKCLYTIVIFRIIRVSVYLHWLSGSCIKLSVSYPCIIRVVSVYLITLTLPHDVPAALFLFHRLVCFDHDCFNKLEYPVHGLQMPCFLAANGSFTDSGNVIHW